MVVTTLPVPQLLGTPPKPEGLIEGNWLDILKTDNYSGYEALLKVKYNTVFALARLLLRPFFCCIDIRAFLEAILRVTERALSSDT